MTQAARNRNSEGEADFKSHLRFAKKTKRTRRTEKGLERLYGGTNRTLESTAKFLWNLVELVTKIGLSAAMLVLFCSKLWHVLAALLTSAAPG